MIRIAVIGLGQIGGSLVLALRAAGVDAHIIGIEPSLRRRKLMRNYLNESSTRWDAADYSDLIFICLHFNLLQKYLKTTTTSALIVDVCSSKEQVVKTANTRNLRMIGGHPMAGNEQKGERGWDVSLFQKKPFFLCPAGISTSADRRRLTALLRKIGCQPIVVNSAKHDQAVAITSHLPALLAHSYVKLARGIPEEFKGPGFHSFTRPGRCSIELLKTFMNSNAKNIRKAVARLKRKMVRV
ncbi:MAG TPA: prephenate dehydrogenase [Acidobacteriota bacterium]|jgi:prephenate dehydrogenase